jgi:hypothetical protein
MRALTDRVCSMAREVGSGRHGTVAREGGGGEARPT